MWISLLEQRARTPLEIFHKIVPHRPEKRQHRGSRDVCSECVWPTINPTRPSPERRESYSGHCLETPLPPAARHVSHVPLPNLPTAQKTQHVSVEMGLLWTLGESIGKPPSTVNPVCPLCEPHYSVRLGPRGTN